MVTDDVLSHSSIEHGGSSVYLHFIYRAFSVTLKT
jgi:hypothetical protein